MAPQFIEVSGVVINTSQISFIDFRSDGTAAVHLGSNSITVEGTEAAGLRRFFAAQPEAAPDADGPSRHEDLVEIEVLRHQLQDAAATIRNLNTPAAPPNPDPVLKEQSLHLVPDAPVIHVPAPELVVADNEEHVEGAAPIPATPNE